MKVALPKGVFDIFPYITDAKHMWRHTFLWHRVEDVIHEVCDLYGFSEIRTPVFEKSEVFLHVGEQSDIVKKEMYTFLDKKGRSLTLRPEGTAPIARSFIDNPMSRRDDNKFYYILPMFRYERQQSGRYRQHHQFGLEAIGVRHPLRDAEVLSLLWHFYSAVGLQHMQIQLNFLGGELTRKRYDQVLREYFFQYLDSLSSLSRERFNANLLRILDSKEPEDQEIIKSAPPILDYISDEDRKYFDEILSALNTLDIPHSINPRLVRGLDYYTDVVFEAITTFGGHSYALGGGGRYDGLIGASGGPVTPACGFGVGLERVIQTLLAQGNLTLPFSQKLRLIPVDSEADSFCFVWAQHLRSLGIPTEVDWTHKKLKIALKTADAEKVTFVCPIGERELLSEELTIKNMSLRQEFSGSKQEIEQRLLYEIQNTSL
ncbi:Histidine--tRNA ligase,histidyl-tRNA synthetase,Histidyl-tRNA synthetase,histidine--tRNA ligase,tRNA synthetase class II core domain (G, H, P, S and T) [Chlamydia poikilotherma]|uniref:Histidine--tRNA ligase n=1 Tax=Chlamydia poikilotherma TaxID=1967783 RepID=A0A3B0PLI5_9CHLA|nr:histidine--tRNA ligase [Chlamydia poikilotherma]SYX08569.1 Histidine--tRNA ligase,histidyl-tRNA synthetase,Histidyl-tRNA synthetase,histidine--tRNA ligase,tRNA synthetase class II core domain (G, H, P, S and T) [Chlamydia poikilotherma]